LTLPPIFGTFPSMKDYEIERTAMRMTQEYGKKALAKSVEVAKYYLGENDNEAAKRWVSIGYAIKKLMQIESVKDILTITDDVKEPEEV
jgi:hypothetical protein